MKNLRIKFLGQIFFSFLLLNIALFLNFQRIPIGHFIFYLNNSLLQGRDPEIKINSNLLYNNLDSDPGINFVTSEILFQSIQVRQVSIYQFIEIISTVQNFLIKIRIFESSSLIFTILISFGLIITIAHKYFYQLLFKNSIIYLFLTVILIVEVAGNILKRGQGIYVWDSLLKINGSTVIWQDEIPLITLFIDNIKILFLPFSTSSLFGFEPRNISSLLLSLLLIQIYFFSLNSKGLLILLLAALIHLPTTLMVLPLILIIIYLFYPLLFKKFLLLSSIFFVSYLVSIIYYPEFSFIIIILASLPSVFSKRDYVKRINFDSNRNHFIFISLIIIYYLFIALTALTALANGLGYFTGYWFLYGLVEINGRLLPILRLPLLLTLVYIFIQKWQYSKSSVRKNLSERSVEMVKTEIYTSTSLALSSGILFSYYFYNFLI
jgi:hypothetical protein